ncbi:MAG: TetR/AcrR family transcriptional regulator [Acholeplasmataceae bacterium]|nr:MAG: TetR/AcrR family transcriptional regulator [Acholeplasmataceae bacterium]
MGRITKALKEETRQHIIETARELFTKHGYEQTKTKTIAKACGIAEGTLFNYFASKDEILITIFEAIGVDEVETSDLPSPIEMIMIQALHPIKRMNNLPRGMLFDLFIASLKLARKKPTLFHRLAALDLNYIEALTQTIERCTGTHDDPLSAKELSHMIYGVVAADFLFYLYHQDTNYQDFANQVKRKLNFLISTYFKEVKHVDSTEQGQ